MSERIRVIEGDITQLTADAIVNAANASLLGGGGVDGAIHRAAGPELLAACRALGGCATGQAKATRGFRLPARWVIHIVGPVWRGGVAHEEALLADCYCNSLAVAAQLGAQTVAFAAISTGVYRFPAECAAQIAVRELRAWLGSHALLREVILVGFGERAFRLLSDALCAPTNDGSGG